VWITIKFLIQAGTEGDLIKPFASKKKAYTNSMLGNI
jgi:hypothetical protein